MKYFDQNKNILIAKKGDKVPTKKRTLKPVTIVASEPARSQDYQARVYADRDMYTQALEYLYHHTELDAEGMQEAYKKFPQLKNYMRRIGISEDDVLGAAADRDFELDVNRRRRTEQGNRENRQRRQQREQQFLENVRDRPDYEHLRRGMTYAAAAPFILATGGGEFAGRTLYNMGKEVITAPLKTAVTVGGGMLGGEAVDRTVQHTTGDANFGEMMGKITGTPELAGGWQLTNPGYAAGGWASNGVYRGLRSGATRFIDGMFPRTQQVALVSPEGQVVRVNIPAPRTMNMESDGTLSWRERFKGRVKQEGTSAAEQTASESATQTQPRRFNGYYDENGNAVKLYEQTDPKATYYRRYGGGSQPVYEKLPLATDKGPVYDVALNEVAPDALVPGQAYTYGDGSQVIAFRKVSNPLPTKQYYVTNNTPEYVFYNTDVTPETVEGVVTTQGTPAQNIFREVNPSNANRYTNYVTENGQTIDELYNSPIRSQRRRITPTNEELVEDTYDVTAKRARKAAKNPNTPENRRILHQYAGNAGDGTVVSDPLNPETLAELRAANESVRKWRKGLIWGGIGTSTLTGPGRWLLGNGIKWTQWTPGTTSNEPATQSTPVTVTQPTPADTTGRYNAIMSLIDE